MKKTSILILTALIIIAFSNSALAQSVNSVKVLIQDGSSNPVEGVSASLYDSNNSLVSYGQSNNLGYVQYFFVAEGSYTIKVNPQSSYSCVGLCGKLQDRDVAVTISTSEPGYDSGTSILTLDPISLTAASRYLLINVTEGAPGASSSTVGDPIAGSWVSAWNNPESGQVWRTATTDSNGQVAFAIDESDTSKWSVSFYSSGGLYGYAYRYDIETASSGETAVSLTPIKADSTMQINLVDRDGNAFTLPDGSYASATCYSQPDYSLYFTGSASSGSSSMNVSVVAGYTYKCYLWLEGYGSSSVDATISTSGATVTVNASILSRDAAVTIKLVDQNNTLITDVNASTYCFSQTDAAGNPFYDYAYSDITSGSVSLSLIGDVVYQCSVYIVNSISAAAGFKGLAITINGDSYLNQYELKSVTATASATQELAFTLTKSDANIEVTVLNNDKTPAQYAWVGASEEITEEGKGFGMFAGGTTNSEGKVTLPLVGGEDGKTRNYIVYAYPQSSYSGGVLPPPIEKVSLKAGGNAEVTMRALEADYALTISVTAPEDAVIQYSSCYGYADGANSFVPDLSSGAGTMYISSDRTWRIGCYGYSDQTFYFSQEESFTPTGDSGSLAITLVDAGSYYQPESHSFDCATATTITLPDGLSTLYVPAEAIAASGTCSITLGTASGYNVSGEEFPAFAWDFTARDGDGNEVTEFTYNMVLTFYYDDSQLPEGMSEEDLAGKVYNPDTKAWDNPEGVEVDSETNTIKITLSHFSTYAAVGDRLDLLSAPVTVRVKQKKGRIATNGKYAVTISWSEVEGATGYNFQFRKYRKSDRNRSTSERFESAKVKSATSRSKTVSLAAGSYEVRVNSENDLGAGSYSIPKRFTVK